MNTFAAEDADICASSADSVSGNNDVCACDASCAFPAANMLVAGVVPSGSCALVAASTFNREHFLAHYSQGDFACVVAVDGGYAHLSACECIPNLAIGDFDSLGFVPSDCPVLEYPAQKDQSDLELAFEWAVEQGFSDFTVYGALGERLDQTLASLQVFAQVSERRVPKGSCSVRAVDERAVLQLLHGPASIQFPSGTRGVVSVFSACDEAQGVCEEGLLYSFPKGPLSNRTSQCLSNELIGRSARISVEQGTLYVLWFRSP